jgi:predicted NAD-dependent protein-ADP-ribosyltransferase YbiA (DUF1768 family)
MNFLLIYIFAMTQLEAVIAIFRKHGLSASILIPGTQPSFKSPIWVFEMEGKVYVVYDRDYVNGESKTSPFSRCHPLSITINVLHEGESFKFTSETLEGLFHAFKAIDNPELLKQIAACGTWMEVQDLCKAKLSTKPGAFWDAWALKSISVSLFLEIYKAIQNRDYLCLLAELAGHEVNFVEGAFHPTWGTGRDGLGRNLAGTVLTMASKVCKELFDLVHYTLFDGNTTPTVRVLSPSSFLDLDYDMSHQFTGGRAAYVRRLVKEMIKPETLRKYFSDPIVSYREFLQPEVPCEKAAEE